MRVQVNKESAADIEDTSCCYPNQELEDQRNGDVLENHK